MARDLGVPGPRRTGRWRAVWSGHCMDPDCLPVEDRWSGKHAQQRVAEPGGRGEGMIRAHTLCR
jgi:hypothetical protein